MQIQRLVDLEDYEFDTLLVTYNHKNRLSIELGKVSEIFESLQADGLVGGSKVYGLRGKDFSYQGVQHRQHPDSLRSFHLYVKSKSVSSSLLHSLFAHCNHFFAMFIVYYEARGG